MAFSFPDIVKLCSKNNISGLFKPGGSINDKLVVEEAEKSNISYGLYWDKTF